MWKIFKLLILKFFLFYFDRLKVFWSSESIFPRALVYSLYSVNSAIIPPTLVALITENLGILVTITGAYAGAGIQYIIPATLVWFGRNRLKNLEKETNLSLPNPAQSVFNHPIFVWGILGWSFLAIGLVTTNFIIKAI